MILKHDEMCSPLAKAAIAEYILGVLTNEHYRNQGAALELIAAVCKGDDLQPRQFILLSDDILHRITALLDDSHSGIQYRALQAIISLMHMDDEDLIKKLSLRERVEVYIRLIDHEKQRIGIAATTIINLLAKQETQAEAIQMLTMQTVSKIAKFLLDPDAEDRDISSECLLNILGGHQKAAHLPKTAAILHLSQLLNGGERDVQILDLIKQLASRIVDVSILGRGLMETILPALAHPTTANLYRPYASLIKVLPP
ncbi:hypothetical protein C8F01DRAFT_1245215 [Mycena amicta]|nr:hypothetical protein C8F01DRAFT_1245215 [Mycena amicta]